MESFRSKLQIFVLFSHNNKYNLFFRQQPWHYIRSIYSSVHPINISDDYYDSYRKSMPILLKNKHQNESKRKYFWNSQKKSKLINSKEQKFAKQKLIFWKNIFGLNPKRSQSKPNIFYSGYRRSQIDRNEEDSRLLDSHQETNRNMLMYESINEPKDETEPQPTPPPGFKEPTAVLLNKIMLKGSFDQDENYEGKKVIPETFRKPYDEMKPPSNIEEISNTHRDIESEHMKSESTQCQMSAKMNAAAAHESSIKILRHAMEQEERQARSRIEQLKLLVNEKMYASQRASLSRINLKYKNSSNRKA